MLRGILHCLELFGLVGGDAFEPTPIEGEFVVDTPPGRGIAYRKSADMDDRDETGAQNDTRVNAVSQTDDWIEVERGRWLPKRYLKPVRTVDPRDAITTSDVCHAHTKPATVPAGWADEAELIDAEKCWYKHVYRRQGTDVRQDDPPVGTRSMCALLAADAATAHFVGKPTVFLSHAWLFKILNVAQALRAFVESQPEDAPEVFFWANSLRQSGCAAQALPLLEEAAPALAAQLGAEDQKAAWAQEQLECVRQDLGRHIYCSCFCIVVRHIDSFCTQIWHWMQRRPFVMQYSVESL